jgi:hypothetical protein
MRERPAEIGTAAPVRSGPQTLASPSDAKYAGLSGTELLEYLDAAATVDERTAVRRELARRLHDVANDALANHPLAAREIVNRYYAKIVDEEIQNDGVRGAFAKLNRLLGMESWRLVKNGPYIGVRTRMRAFVNMARQRDGEDVPLRQAQMCGDLIRAVQGNE